MNYFFIFDDREFGEHNEWYIIEADNFSFNKERDLTIFTEFKMVDCCECFKKFLKSGSYHNWFSNMLKIPGHTFSAYKYNSMDILVRKHFTDML